MEELDTANYLLDLFRKVASNHDYRTALLAIKAEEGSCEIKVSLVQGLIKSLRTDITAQQAVKQAINKQRRRIRSIQSEAKQHNMALSINFDLSVSSVETNVNEFALEEINILSLQESLETARQELGALNAEISDQEWHLKQLRQLELSYEIQLQRAKKKIESLKGRVEERAKQNGALNRIKKMILGILR